MAFTRTAVAAFELANPFYVGATVTFYTVDTAGTATTTLATLYGGVTGTTTLTNPQVLDSEGKFQQPVYIDEPVIAKITTNDTAKDHETGIIFANLAQDAVDEAQNASNLALAQAALLERAVSRVNRAVATLPIITSGQEGYFLRIKTDLSGRENIAPATVRSAIGAVQKVSSTDHAVARFNGTTGDLQDSGLIVDDAGGVSGFASINGNTLAGLSGWGNVLAPHEGLTATRASASTLDIDAAGVLVRNDSGDVRWLENVNVTVDISASGANGLDTGAEAGARWYIGYIIYNPTTDTTAGLLSQSTADPTMPSGYTYKGRVTAIYNDGALDFRNMYQRGRTCIASRTTPLNAAAAATYTAISLSLHVPPIATKVHADMQCDKSSGTSEIIMSVASDGSGTSASYGLSVVVNPSGIGASTPVSRGASIVLATPQQVKYFVSGTNGRGYFYMHGYDF